MGWDDAESHPTEGGSNSESSFNPWLFFGFLFLPCLIYLAFFLVNLQGTKLPSTLVSLTFVIPPVIAGIICGGHVALAQNASPVTTLWTGLLYSVLCAFISAAIPAGLFYGGCLLLISSS